MEFEYVDEEGMWTYKCMLEVLLAWNVIDLDKYVGILLRLDEQWKRKPTYYRLTPWDYVREEK